jgi:hypothetical protein
MKLSVTLGIWWKYVEDSSILQCAAIYWWQRNKCACYLHCQPSQSSYKILVLVYYSMWCHILQDCNL